MIRAKLAGGLLLSLVLSAPQARAILVAYEGFDYPDSSTLLHNRAGGSGWSGGWADNDQDYNGTLTADNTSLTSPAFPFTPIGDRISTTGGGEANRFLGTTFDMTQDGTEFFGSFLLRKSVDGGESGDAVEMRLISNLTTTEALRLGIGSDEAIFFDSGANSITGTEPIPLGDTQFFVFKAVSSAAGDDQFFATAYGPGDTVPGTEPGTWDVMLSEAVNHVFNGVRMNTGGSVAGAEYDEIRLGDTWADVTQGTSFLLGDFNGSNTIDPGDLDALVSGLYVGNSYQEGDLDQNGIVDLRDYNAFRDIYLSAGFTLQAVTSVPEPGTWVTLAVVITAYAVSRRKWRG
jgi:hypothetical protein